MHAPETIAYSMIIGDLFHIGHLKMLENAFNSSDYHICGVVSDEIVSKWSPPLICTFEERKEVINQIRFVHETLLQDSLDPTENLKKIHERFPGAKIRLVQNHILGGSSILGVEYINHINGEVISHNFYSNLSRDFIRNAFIKDFIQNHDLKKISVNDIKFGDIDYFQKHFSTKANTIKSLRRILKNAIIEKEFIFTVEQWTDREPDIVKAISNTFQNSPIVIRSSSLNEDSIEYSNAGHYESILNVNSSDFSEIKTAITSVLNSYSRGGNFSKENQILVQKQTQDVLISGVVFTRNLWSNTPYYLINYDDNSAKTDTVTGGLANAKIEILKKLPLEKINSKWYNLISAVHEIESFFKGITLDIEFAIKNNGDVVIFQVRPLAANSRFFSLDDELIMKKISRLQQQYNALTISDTSEKIILSEELFLSDMAFWNPAELIGDRPNYLDYSLFYHLIMKTNWNEALIPLGYAKVSEPLMVLMGNKPYINFHNAALSLLPEELPNGLKTKLLNFYNKKLRNNPELHDKVEFEIIHNCYSFDFDLRSKELLDNDFSNDEIQTLRDLLLKLTSNLLSSYKRFIKKDRTDIAELEQRYLHLKYFSEQPITVAKYTWKEKLEIIYQLLEDCKTLGTTQFSRVARMAFIGTVLLKSLRDTYIISSEDFNDFMNSISTVATQMDNDFSLLRDRHLLLEDFIVKYGHLRPGTYDITKLPYKKNITCLLSGSAVGEKTESNKNSDATLAFREIKIKLGSLLTQLCNEHRINKTGAQVLDFIKTAIELREYFKFVYTKNISLAIELIAEVGNEFGFTREQLSNLDYNTVVNSRFVQYKEEIINIWQNLINGRIDEKRIDLQVSLPPIIFSEQDFVMVQTYIAKPNFITGSIIEGEIVLLDVIEDNINIDGKIVVIEKADPGYDWVFTKNIKALITKYGGAASHMAIRCAEFNIPAAIGCGDIIFSQICNAQKLIVDCKNKTIYTF